MVEQEVQAGLGNTEEELTLPEGPESCTGDSSSLDLDLKGHSPLEKLFPGNKIFLEDFEDMSEATNTSNYF